MRQGVGGGGPSGDEHGARLVSSHSSPSAICFRLHSDFMTYFVSVGRNHRRLCRGLVFPAHPRFRKLAASSYKTVLFALDYKMDGCDINMEGNLFDLSRPN